MQNYQILGRKGEGTFSEVLKAEDKATGQLVAIKCMKKRFKSVDQVNKLREVLSIRRLQAHHNIVRLIAVLFDHVSGRLALVFELMDLNLYELIKDRKQYLPEDKVCSIAYQMLRGLEYIHSHGLLHRDIKPENLLLNVNDNTLKIADFGSSRGIYCNQPFTEYISTRWYRAPECLLTDGYYSFKMDLWAAGCVLFEIMALFPLFPGTNELDQIHKIHNVLGTPSAEVLEGLKAKGRHMAFDFPPRKGIGLQKLLPQASPEALDLLTRLLEYDEDRRITAKEALRHPYFKKMRDMERRQRATHRRRATGSGGTALATSAVASADGSSPPPSIAAVGAPPAGTSDGAGTTRHSSCTSADSPSVESLERKTLRRLSGTSVNAMGMSKSISQPHGDGVLPSIDGTTPTKQRSSGAGNWRSTSFSSLTRRNDMASFGDNATGAGCGGGPRASGAGRVRKTRKMSLPKL